MALTTLGGDLIDSTTTFTDVVRFSISNAVPGVTQLCISDFEASGINNLAFSVNFVGSACVVIVGEPVLVPSPIFSQSSPPPPPPPSPPVVIDGPPMRIKLEADLDGAAFIIGFRSPVDISDFSLPYTLSGEAIISQIQLIVDEADFMFDLSGKSGH